MSSWLENLLGTLTQLLASNDGTNLPLRANWNYGTALTATDNDPQDRIDIDVDSASSTGPGTVPIIPAANRIMISDSSLDPQWLTSIGMFPVEMTDNTLDVVKFSEGVNNYLVMSTLDGSESLSAGNALTELTFRCKDSSASACRLLGPAGLVILSVNTTAKEIELSNTADAYKLTVKGAGGVHLEGTLFTSGGSSHNVETLTDTKTLVITDPYHHQLDGGVLPRDVEYPAEALSAGLEYLIENVGNTDDLVLKDDGGSTIITIPPGQSALSKCNGTLWIATRVLSNSEGVTVEYLSAFQISNLTLTSQFPGDDANDLLLTLGIGTWTVDVHATWVCGSGSTDGISHDMSHQGTVTTVLRTSDHSSSTTGSKLNSLDSNNLTTNHNQGGVSNARHYLKQRTTIVVTVAGDLRWRASKNSDAGADTVLQAGSSIRATRQLP